MSVIERGNGCFWLFEVSLLDKSVQPVVLAGGVFGVHKHAKAVLEGDFCHRLILQLNTERIGHRCHVHFDKLINGALVGHDLLPPLNVNSHRD